MNSLAFDNVSFAYSKQHPLFDGLSFSFRAKTEDRGFIIGLMGASGSGKTTLVKLLNGSLIPQQGRIRLEPEKPVLSYLPQEAVLFGHLSPYENARYFQYIAAYKNHFDPQLFEHLVKVLNMGEVLAESKSIDELSGGQRQRLALLRALSIRPDILLLDEPLAGLDGILKINLMHQIRQLVLQQKILAVYVSHSKDECDIVADELGYLHFDPEKKRNTLFQDELQTFSARPPVLDAVRTFDYPRQSILSCRFTDDRLLPCPASDKEAFYLAIKPQNISFSASEGFSFEIISRNSLLTLVQINDSQHLTIDTFSCPTDNSHKLVLNGELIKYAPNQEFMGILELKNNERI